MSVDKPALTRFALFGAGRMGSLHFRDLILNERAEPIYVVDEKEEFTEKLVAKFKVEDKVKACHISNMDEVLADPRINAVMVCTPSFTHEPIVKAALAAGKEVFCEKPVAPTLQATEACYSLASNNLLFCAFNRRYDPQIRKLYNAIREGDVGKLRYIHQTSRDPACITPKEYIMTSGGILIDSVVHDIDMALWLVGETPRTVYCTGQVTHKMYAECNDVDTCVLMLTFGSGVICTINVCREADYGYDQRIEVFGTKGMLESTNKRPLSYNKWTPGGTSADSIYNIGTERYMDSYRLELEHFLDVIRGEAQEEVTKDSTLNVYKVVELAKQSMKKGQVLDFSPK